MTNENTNNLEILNDHYNQTFSLLKGYSARRDRLFLYILALISMILLYLLAPNLIGDWISLFIENNVITNTNSNPNPGTIDPSFIGAVLWFGLLSLTHTYFQTNLHVQRQYDYLYALEDEISPNFKGIVFTREGKHYKNFKLQFSKLTKIIYWYVFPLLLFAFIILWEYFLFTSSGVPIVYIVVETIISAILIISEIFYLLAIKKIENLTKSSHAATLKQPDPDPQPDLPVQ